MPFFQSAVELAYLFLVLLRAYG